MDIISEQYLIDKEGKRKAVLVPISVWENILKVLEQFDEIREYDEAKRDSSEIIPFEQAIFEIKQGTVD